MISVETIKPSSPTPKSLQKHLLSFLDQSTQSMFVPFVYFYSSNPQIPNSKKSKTLKTSLSETLTIYYPLAGRLIGNLYVDCNDEGIPFIQAESGYNLSEVITNQNPNILNKFLPFKINEPQYFLMAVQATYFRCGGVAVGILISHKLADGLSNIMFAYTWSSIARNQKLPLPKFDAAAYFPPLHSSVPEISAPETKQGEVVVSKIFTFGSAKIADLQKRYSGGGRHWSPSRVAALSAFVWTVFMSSTVTRSDPNKTCIVQHALNLRTRMYPPLSAYNFGNIAGPAVIKTTTGDDGIVVIRKMEEAMKAVDDGYVENLMKHLEELESSTKSRLGEVVRLNFSSMSGFPFYEVNFGWGIPDSVRMAELQTKNVAIFMDAKNKDGIDILIHLSELDMEKFEALLKLEILKSNL